MPVGGGRLDSQTEGKGNGKNVSQVLRHILSQQIHYRECSSLRCDLDCHQLTVTVWPEGDQAGGFMYRLAKSTEYKLCIFT